MKKAIGIFLLVFCMSVLTYTLVVDAKGNHKGDIKGLDIKYERAFIHEINGVTIQLDITNKTGKDVKIYEDKNLTSGPVGGFELHHQNSYSLNGKTLKNGKTKVNELLLYFDQRAKNSELQWVQPSFKVVMDGKEYHIKGEKMYTE
jgi:hypothetical protein